MATALITEFHLLESLIAYLTIDPSEATIPCRESAQLCIESYRTWCMLLRYNLGVSCYRDLYPLLMKQLLYFIEKVDIAPAAEDKQFDYDIGCWLLTMLTNVLGCISFNSELAWTHVDDLRNGLLFFYILNLLLKCNREAYIFLNIYFWILENGKKRTV